MISITDLMGVQIHDENFADAAFPLHEEANAQGNVRIGTEAAPSLSAAMVEAAANVDSPPTLHRQLGSLGMNTRSDMRHASVQKRTSLKLGKGVGKTRNTVISGRLGFGG
jgi:hypothetical protein